MVRVEGAIQLTLPEGTVAVITSRRAGSKGEPIQNRKEEAVMIATEAYLSAAQGYLSFGAEDANGAGQVDEFMSAVVALGSDFDLVRMQQEARIALKERLPEPSRIGQPARVIGQIVDFLAMTSLEAIEQAERKVS